MLWHTQNRCRASHSNSHQAATRIREKSSPRFENYLPVFYLFIYRYLPLFRVSKHILPKITWITCFLFNISFVFLKKCSGIYHMKHPPSNKIHNSTSHRSHLPSLSIGLLPLRSFGSGHFFLHLFRCRNSPCFFPPPKKKNG